MDIVIPDWPAPVTVRAAISTRISGFSSKPWDSLNLAFHVGDDSKTVTKNWQKLADYLGFESFPQLLNQVHGTDLVEALCDGGIPTADGCFSHVPGQVCTVMTADCLPILLCNTAGTEVAAIHAGWRGLAAGIVDRAMSCFSSHPDQLMAYLGPAISQQYFEVGAEVRNIFLESAYQTSRKKISDCFIEKAGRSDGNKWMADLYGLARVALNDMGVEQIYGGEFCTYDDVKHFYSYRRDGQTGRMASLIWIS